jgi:hypothetical protein
LEVGKLNIVGEELSIRMVTDMWECWILVSPKAMEFSICLMGV